MKNIFAEYLRHMPFVRLVIPFIAGIILQKYFVSSNLSIFIFSILMAFFAYIFSPISKKYALRWIGGVLIFIAMLIFGAAIKQNKQSATQLPQTATIFAAKIIEQPEEKENFFRAQVRICAYRDSANDWISAKEKAIVYIAKDSIAATLNIGDMLAIATKFTTIEAPKNPEEFDYKRYLARRGIFTSAFVRSNEYTFIRHEKMWFKQTINNIQTGMFTCFKKFGIEGDELAVLRALTIGDKQLLDDDLRNSYASAGAMHVLAVSGLHVGLVFVVLNFILHFLNRKRYGKIAKALIIIACLWIYAALANFSPSVCRACVMFSFVLAGEIFNRKSNIYNSLAASALLLCVINPDNIFDVGFQLSYSALLAIVYFQPLLYKNVYIKNKILDKIYSLITVAIAAQIGTSAISIFYFHQFPNYFIITNIIIIPLVTIIMYLIAATLIFSWVPLIGAGLGWTLNQCLQLSNLTMKNIQVLPYSLAQNIYISDIQMATIIIGIILLGIFIETKNRKIAIGILACIVLFFSAKTFTSIERRQQQKMIVYCTKGASYISFVHSNNEIVLRDSASVNKTFDFNTKNNYIKMGIKNSNVFETFDSTNIETHIKYYKSFIWFKNRSIKILNEKEKFATQNPIDIDYLIVSKSSGRQAQQALDIFAPNFIVIDASVQNWVAKIWINEAQKHKISYHNVRENGAFIFE